MNRSKNRRTRRARLSRPARSGYVYQPSSAPYSRTAGGASSSRAIVGGFPDRIRVKLQYTERISVTSSSGLTSIYRFAGNDVFDPNVTGSGSQPVNADIFTGQYNRCRVYGSRMQLTLVHISNSVGPYDVVMLPMNLTTSLTFEEYSSQPYAKAYSNYSYVSSAVVLDTSITSAKVLGRLASEFKGSDITQSMTSTSPVELWYWTIAVRATDMSTTTACPLFASITYDVEYFDRKPQVLSLGLGGTVGSAPLTRDEIKKNNLEVKTEETKGTKEDDNLQLQKASAASPANTFVFVRPVQERSPRAIRPRAATLK